MSEDGTPLPPHPGLWSSKQLAISPPEQLHAAAELTRVEDCRHPHVPALFQHVSRVQSLV
jgi:hypothetical protein